MGNKFREITVIITIVFVTHRQTKYDAMKVSLFPALYAHRKKKCGNKKTIVKSVKQNEKKNGGEITWL